MLTVIRTVATKVVLGNGQRTIASLGLSSGSTPTLKVAENQDIAMRYREQILKGHGESETL